MRGRPVHSPLPSLPYLFYAFLSFFLSFHSVHYIIFYSSEFALYPSIRSSITVPLLSFLFPLLTPLYYPPSSLSSLPSAIFPLPCLTGESLSKMNHYSSDIVRNLNGSLVQVLEEWCRVKVSEIRLEREIEAEKHRAGLIAVETVRTLNETLQAGQEELEKAHGKIGRNKAVITAQAEHIAFLSQYTIKVSTFIILFNLFPLLQLNKPQFNVWHSLRK
jgi:hypothetical protein